MKITVLSFVFFIAGTARGQYYYNDIVSTLETNQQMQVWRNNKVRLITATGYDANGTRSTNFSEVREIKDNGSTLKVSTHNGGYLSVYYNRYDEKGRLTNSTDSSLNSIGSSTTYNYDAAGRITEIKTVLSDPGSSFEKTEQHLWKYNTAGQPDKMWRVINGRDSLEIRFEADEKGNPGEEVLYKWGEESSRIYYYYDDKRNVTDIVRFNEKVKKLLPDVMFTYDESGQLIQKVSTTGTDNLGKIKWVGYIIWRYIYNDKGLKTKEALFDKDQELTGKIEYSYQFFQ
ncbi:MAG TPA: RHS repeat protein [Chitinophagaceae bacterium]|nr:RHS repeat protein [Chitinophagaceae bacterium]